MFFKYLELNGFKSFATRTTVDFQPGITVIVGPNGCGKSNIFDAIRWVLGEQSAREMRGSRMGDVIFGGSATLKAQGLAQVSLTIRNEERRLPIDFSEINVTRRLYANGQSEYLLNKTPCRLKDITDLFLDTGIGAHGYSIMEQGKVDTIINAKPLERRHLFEEAAGIAKYRARRAEALRKLERADADFQRLNDLIAEVQRQANSLKRQASKAERYKRLTEEARSLEQRLLAVRHEYMKGRLAQLTREHDALRDRLSALSARIAEVEAAQERERSAEAEAAEQLALLRSRLFELAAEIERAEHSISLLKERIAEGERRRLQIGAEAETDSRAEMALAAELGRARAELDANLARLREAETYYAESKAEFDEMRSGLEGVVERLNGLRQRVADLLAQKAAAENAARISRVLIQRLDDQIETGDGKQRERAEGAKALQARADQLVRRHGEQDQALQARLAERHTLARANEEVSTELESLQTEVSDRRQRLGEARSKLKALEDLESSYQGYYQGVRAAMQAGGRGELSGLVGVVAQLVRSPAEFEVAVEAALGSSVQDIVARTADAARQAVEFLKARSLGKATFLPLDLLQPRQADASFARALQRPRVIGAANRLVQYDPQIETAVQFLLGTTIVVETLELAIDLEREGLRQRYVSLDGQIVSRHGSISGGSVRASGLLSREREIHELRESVAAGELELQSRLTRSADLQASLRAGQERAAALREEIHSLQIGQAELAKDKDACLAALEDRTRALAEYETARAQWIEEIHGHRQAIAEKDREFEQINALVEQNEAALRAVQGEMAAQDTQVDALAGSLSELRVESASIAERVDRLQSRKSRMAKQQWAFSAAQIRRRNEMAAIAERAQQTQTEIERIRESLGALFEGRRALERDIAQGEQEKESLARGLREKIQTLHSLQSDRNELQDETHEAALRKNEVEVQIAQLREQARERFHREIEDLPTADKSQPPAEESPESADEAESPLPPGEAASPLPPGEGRVRVPPAPSLDQLSQDELYARLSEVTEKLDAMGLVNLTALEEYEEQAKRLEFLTGQEADLREARRQLTETIAAIDETTKRMFSGSFEAIRSHFIEMFRRFFGGGRADLILTKDENIDPLLEGGIEIVAQPPGKKLQHISLLSGGEKAQTAIALLFAIFLYRPSPFCVLDEIDAPLDDNNIERFKKLLLEFSQRTQFIIITHSKQTMTLADSIYGVTMEEAGVSKLVAVRFEESLSLAG